MISDLEKKFEKIGAKVSVVVGPLRRRGFTRQTAPVRLDVINSDGKEKFEIAVREDLIERKNREKLEMFVLEVLPKDRHLVFMAREVDENGNVVAKEHFLCGHDERHLFVAAVEPVSTVAGAKASLKPRVIRENETGLNARKRNRRKTRNFKRQGEWFFVPVPRVKADSSLVRKNEPMTRNSRSKPHIAQFALRIGGESVRVCREFPFGLTESEYRETIAANPRAAHFNWQFMRRGATLIVKGSIRHPDHATIVLEGWHMVFMNNERFTEAVAFLD